MRKCLFAVVAVVAALGMMGQSAEAAKKKKAAPQVTVHPSPWSWLANAPWTVRDPRLEASNTVVGAAAGGASFAISEGTHISDGGAYALTSVACAAVSPIVGTVVVNRELSLREVWVSTSNCFLPIIGGWMANAYFDRHPEWDLPPGKRR